MSQNDSTFKINKRSLLTAALIIFILIIGSYCLTLFVPPGHYDVKADAATGSTTVIPDSYTQTGSAGQYPVYNIILSIFKSFAPGGSVNIVMITIMLFILFIGGSFTLLDKSGILRAVIAKIANKMYHKRYLLIAVISFVFMCLGSFFGILEEIVPLIPLVIGLCYMLGWDSLMGLSLSLLSTCFGFSAALYNPFLIGVAQNIAGVPLYSGTLLRLAFFGVTYVVLLLFLLRYARKLDANPLSSPVYREDMARKEKYQLTPDQIREAAQFNQKPIIFVGVLLAVMFAFLIAAPYITISGTSLSTYSLPFIGIIFILASTIGSKIAGYKSSAKTFLKGIGDIAPGILLIPMAMAVSTIIKDSGIQDTLLKYCSSVVTNTSPYVNVLIIYAAILVLQFFVAQASAKAFLVLPLIVPLAAMSGISGQTVVFTYAIGDGFLNVLYPTNAMLLIALGLTTVSYTKWFKFTIWVQLLIHVISIGFLMLAVAIGYV